MDKERLIFEMFKDVVLDEHKHKMYFGICNFRSKRSTTYLDIRKICDKMKADYSKVCSMLNYYKRKWDLEEYKANFLDRIDREKFCGSTKDVYGRTKVRTYESSYREINNFIKRNEVR